MSLISQLGRHHGCGGAIRCDSEHIINDIDTTYYKLRNGKDYAFNRLIVHFLLFHKKVRKEINTCTFVKGGVELNIAYYQAINQELFYSNYIPAANAFVPQKALPQSVRRLSNVRYLSNREITLYLIIPDNWNSLIGNPTKE